MNRCSQLEFGEKKIKWFDLPIIYCSLSNGQGHAMGLIKNFWLLRFDHFRGFISSLPISLTMCPKINLLHPPLTDSGPISRAECSSNQLSICLSLINFCHCESVIKHNHLTDRPGGYCIPNLFFRFWNLITEVSKWSHYMRIVIFDTLVFGFQRIHWW